MRAEEKGLCWDRIANQSTKQESSPLPGDRNLTLPRQAPMNSSLTRLTSSPSRFLIKTLSPSPVAGDTIWASPGSVILELQFLRSQINTFCLIIVSKVFWLILGRLFTNIRARALPQESLLSGFQMLPSWFSGKVRLQTPLFTQQNVSWSLVG